MRCTSWLATPLLYLATSLPLPLVFLTSYYSETKTSDLLYSATMAGGDEDEKVCHCLPIIDLTYAGEGVVRGRVC